MPPHGSWKWWNQDLAKLLLGSLRTKAEQQLLPRGCRNPAPCQPSPAWGGPAVSCLTHIPFGLPPLRGDTLPLSLSVVPASLWTPCHRGRSWGERRSGPSSQPCASTSISPVTFVDGTSLPRRAGPVTLPLPGVRSGGCQPGWGVEGPCYRSPNPGSAGDDANLRRSSQASGMLEKTPRAGASPGPARRGRRASGQVGTAPQHRASRTRTGALACAPLHGRGRSSRTRSSVPAVPGATGSLRAPRRSPPEQGARAAAAG